MPACAHVKEIRDVTPSADGCEECLTSDAGGSETRVWRGLPRSALGGVPLNVPPKPI